MRPPSVRIARTGTIALALAISADVRAATWIVDPGGGGDALTIAAGLALASAGDHVLVVAGTYAEHDLQLKPLVTLESQSGAAATVIDAGLLGHGVIGADNAVIRGFTIRRAGGLNHHAVYCYQNSPQILDNVIRDNDERAVLLFRSNAVVRGNEIHANPATFSSAVIVVQSAATVAGNRILAHDPNGNVSAIELADTGPGAAGASLIEDNYIVGRIFMSSLQHTTEIRRNVCLVLNGFSEALNIAFTPGPLVIHHNTLIGGSGIFAQGGSTVTITNNIVAHARTGIGSFGGTLTLGCNDFWDNQTNYSGVAPGVNDFSADPRFCDEAAGNYDLTEDSPCAAAHSPAGCGLVGAREVTCASTPTRRATWGALKSLYRN